MTCATAPAHWAPQARLPHPVMRFLRVRLEAALEDPSARLHLVWPMVLGSPRLRSTHPGGLSLSHVLREGGRTLAALGCDDPETAWHAALEAFPDTADQGAGGWLPHRIWEPLAEPVSLRCGVILLALTGQPVDARYRLASGATLFNAALFHECHDALETLWAGAEGDLKEGLQGLILMTAGFFHQQVSNAPGMLALWPEALDLLEPFDGTLKTPWGRIAFGEAQEAVAQRVSWLREQETGADLGPLWSLPRPAWEWLP